MGVGAVASAELTLTVDDEKGSAFAPSSLAAAEGDTAGADYTVKLASRPEGTVAVAVAAASDEAEVEVSPGSLTFPPSGWNAPQTVTVTARGYELRGACPRVEPGAGSGSTGEARRVIRADRSSRSRSVAGGAGPRSFPGVRAVERQLENVSG